jgi:uncharacterized membrane protein
MRASLSFEGPLPPPGLLAQYNDAAPNGADRILAMAERQAAHRQELEKIVIHGDARRADRGLYSGTAIVLLSVVAGFFLVLLDHDGAGVAFVGSGLAALAGMFV